MQDFKPIDPDRKVGTDNKRLSLPECYGTEYMSSQYQDVCQFCCVHGAAGSGGCKAMLDFIDGRFKNGFAD